MSSQGVLRSASAQSTSSFDSLDEFLSEFEVINKEDQQACPAPLPLLHQFGDRVRPPRPAPVRLSVQPYNATRQSKRQSQGDNASDISALAASGGYQNLALLPVSEPCGGDAGHLYDASPGHAWSNKANAVESTPAQTGPASPLSGYTEQLQRDLGARSGSPLHEHAQFSIAVSCPAPSGQDVPNQGPVPTPMAAAQQSMPMPQTWNAAAPFQTASRPAASISRPAASISSAEGAAFTNPLMSMPGRHHTEGSTTLATQPNLQRSEVRLPRYMPGARAEPAVQPAPLKQVRQQSAARTGIHPLSRGSETLLKGPAPASIPQQRPETSGRAATANVLSSPVPSTVRVAQQTLRKRDFESELLERLLNGQQASAPAQGQQAPLAGTKQPTNCLHLPVPRVLLITVVFALMAIPLLLFTAGRVQAQHHMKQQVYVGSVAVNHSIEGPISDPVALPAGIDNATGEHHAAAIARDEGLKSALDSSQTATADLQDYLSAKERRRGQPGLKLLSFRLTVSLPSAMPTRLIGPRAILGDDSA